MLFTWLALVVTSLVAFTKLLFIDPG